jgi:hypothetical protein
MIFAEADLNASILQLIGGLGQSAAAVVMAWLFITFLQKKDEAQEKRDNRIFEQSFHIAKEMGEVVRDNTEALSKIEGSIGRLIGRNQSGDKGS